MSRCYPFPPPGYAGKCSSHEALILSIKLQKERARAVSDNAAEKLIPEKLKSLEKRKDKEDRKKERKDKEGRKKEKNDKEERRKDRKEKKKDEKAKASAPVDNVAFKSKSKLLEGSSTELLERSSVTEEHGQPIDFQNSSCSSENTGNSGKRKRIAASPSNIQSNGNIIRIRISSSQKRDEPTTSVSKEQEASPVPQEISQTHFQRGVTLVRPESLIKLIKLKDEITNGVALPHAASTSMANLQLLPVLDDVSRLKEKTIGSTSHKEKLLSHEKSKSSQSLDKLSSRDKKMQKKDSLYKKLFVDWVAPPLERTMMVDENEDDEEWLVGKKGDDKPSKRLRVCEESGSYGDDLSCLVSAVMQPRAQLLADVGIYALPFTVQF